MMLFPLWSRALGALSLGAALLLSAPRADAQAPERAEPRPAGPLRLPRLSVHRTADSLDCPDAWTLAGLVARHMKRPALEPLDEARAPLPPHARGGGPQSSLDVQIYRSEEGYTAVVQTEVAATSPQAPRGSRLKARQLSDRGATCAGLAAALSITMAILLDTEVPLPPPPPEPLAAPDLGLAPASAASPASSSPSSPRPAAPDRDRPEEASRLSVTAGRDATGAGAASPGPRDAGRGSASARPEAAGRSAASARSFGLTLGFGLNVVEGVLPRGGLAESGYLELRLGQRFSMDGGMMVFAPQTSPYTTPVKGAEPGKPEVETWLTVGIFRGCARFPVFSTPMPTPEPSDQSPPDRTHVGACLGVLAGAIHGEAHNLPQTSPATDPWAAGEASGLLKQRLFGPLALVSRAALLVPFVTRAFRVEGGGTAFSPPPVAVRLDAELRLSIW